MQLSLPTKWFNKVKEESEVENPVDNFRFSTSARYNELEEILSPSQQQVYYAFTQAMALPETRANLAKILYDANVGFIPGTWPEESEDVHLLLHYINEGILDYVIRHIKR